MKKWFVFFVLVLLLGNIVFAEVLEQSFNEKAADVLSQEIGVPSYLSGIFRVVFGIARGASIENFVVGIAMWVVLFMILLNISGELFNKWYLGLSGSFFLMIVFSWIGLTRIFGNFFMLIASVFNLGVFWEIVISVILMVGIMFVVWLIIRKIKKDQEENVFGGNNPKFQY